jgi:hypothetical protein
MCSGKGFMFAASGLPKLSAGTCLAMALLSMFVISEWWHLHI